MALTEQKKKLLKAKIAVALQNELGRVSTEEEIDTIFLTARVMYKAVLGLHFQRQQQNGIHPLFWRPERVGLTHHVYRSNRAEEAKPQRETQTEDGSVRPHYGADGEKQRAGS